MIARQIKNSIGFTATIVLCISCGSGGTGDEGDSGDSTQLDVTEFEMDSNRLSAVDFNNSLTGIFNSSTESVSTLFASGPDNVDANLENSLFEMQIDVAKVEAMGCDGGGVDSFKTAVFELLVFYTTELGGSFENEIAPILKMTKIDKANQKKLDAYDLEFASDEKILVDRVMAVQTEFATLNNIKLQ